MRHRRIGSATSFIIAGFSTGDKLIQDRRLLPAVMREGQERLFDHRHLQVVVTVVQVVAFAEVVLGLEDFLSLEDEFSLLVLLACLKGLVLHPRNASSTRSALSKTAKSRLSCYSTT